MTTGPSLLLVSILIGSSLCGCAALTGGSKESHSDPRVEHLSKVLKKRTDELFVTKRENDLLKRKLSELEPGRTLQSSQPPSDSGKESELPGDHLSGLPSLEADKKVYERALRAYKGGDDVLMWELVKKLQSLFPKSVYTDDALYRYGILQMRKSRWSNAIKIFEQIIDKYPSGNLKVRAMMGKASAYKNLKLPSVSSKIYEDVIKMYPKSAEATRAKRELSRLNSTEKKKGV